MIDALEVCQDLSQYYLLFILNVYLRLQQRVSCLCKFLNKIIHTNNKPNTVRESEEDKTWTTGHTRNC